MIIFVMFQNGKRDTIFFMPRINKIPSWVLWRLLLQLIWTSRDIQNASKSIPVLSVAAIPPKFGSDAVLVSHFWTLLQSLPCRCSGFLLPNHLLPGFPSDRQYPQLTGPRAPDIPVNNDEDLMWSEEPTTNIFKDGKGEWGEMVRACVEEGWWAC